MLEVLAQAATSSLSNPKLVYTGSGLSPTARSSALCGPEAQHGYPLGQFSSLSVWVHNAPITNGVVVTFFSFQSVLTSKARSRYLLTFSSSFSLILQSPGHATSMIWHVLLVFSTTTMSGLSGLELNF